MKSLKMHLEDEYFEVGNLIISSHFKGNGEGTVNLTWEVPDNMLSKIKCMLFHFKMIYTIFLAQNNYLKKTSKYLGFMISLGDANFLKIYFVIKVYGTRLYRKNLYYKHGCQEYCICLMIN